MNQGPVARIHSLLSSLPEADIPFGEKYLKAKDYESLGLLVKSALHNVDNALLSIAPTTKQKELLKQYSFESVRLTKLRQLKSEVEEYAAYLDLILDSYSEEENYY